MWQKIFNPAFISHSGIFRIIDFIEITIFAAAIYIFLSWLSKNKYKYLLGYFHLYCIAFFGSYFFKMHALNQFLLFFSPVVFTLLIVFHQKTLQKNLVGVAMKKPFSQIDINWLETVTQVCLFIINKNKSIRCVIERKDPLESLLQSSFMFDANIDKHLLTIILENKVVNTQKLLWLEESGKIRAINTSWDLEQQDEWFAEEYNFEQESQWFEQAKIFTEQTDALIFSITPEKRVFNIIIDGKHIPDVSAYNFLKFVTMYGFKQTYTKKRSKEYVVPNEKDISDQITT
ncbi:hypothetical protein HN446_03980 [bacterium]|jgi:hypothetical protein|nr:hypothetical protein [bacterium]